MSVFLAAFLRPFVTLLLLALILYPVRVLLTKKLKDGKLKRFLLFRIS